MDRHREDLRPYLDDRVDCSGMYVNARPLYNGQMAALVQYIVVTIGDEEYQFGHGWVQDAINFKAIPFGSRVSFSAIVGQYPEATLQGRIHKLNLGKPENIIVTTPPALRIPTPVEIDIAAEVRRLSREVGGIESFWRFVDDMRTAHRNRYHR